MTNETKAEWPERITLRDTRVVADEGQRILTTATGHGYEKKEYVIAWKADEYRAKLFPYADSTEVSGMSWSGFNIIGDKRSIAEVQGALHKASRVEDYRAAFLAENEALKMKLEKATEALDPTEERRKARQVLGLRDDNGPIPFQSMSMEALITKVELMMKHSEEARSRNFNLVRSLELKLVKEGKRRAKANQRADAVQAKLTAILKLIKEGLTS